MLPVTLESILTVILAKGPATAQLTSIFGVILLTVNSLVTVLSLTVLFPLLCTVNVYFPQGKPLIKSSLPGMFASSTVTLFSSTMRYVASTLWVMFTLTGKSSP